MAILAGVCVSIVVSVFEKGSRDPDNAECLFQDIYHVAAKLRIGRR
jgi:hypothetical protein